MWQSEQKDSVYKSVCPKWLLNFDARERRRYALKCTFLTKHTQPQRSPLLLRLHHLSVEAGDNGGSSKCSFPSESHPQLSNAALNQTTAQLQGREFCCTLCLKIDQRVRSAPYFLCFFLFFTPNQNSRQRQQTHWGVHRRCLFACDRVEWFAFDCSLQVSWVFFKEYSKISCTGTFTAASPLWM